MKSSSAKNFLATTITATLCVTVLSGCMSQLREAVGKRRLVEISESDTANSNLKSADPLTRARALFMLGDMNATEKEIDAALAQKSANEAEFWALKGDIKDYQCQYQQAVEDYTKAIEINPNVSEAWTGRSDAYLRLNNFAEARVNNDKAVTLGSKANLAFEIDNLEKDSKRAIKNKPQEWTIACTASFFANRKIGNNSLTGGVSRENSIKTEQKNLRNLWNVSSRDDLFNILRGLAHHVDSQRWVKMRNVLNDPILLQPFATGWHSTADFDYAVNLIKAHSKEYGDRDLSAWDYVRYLNVCRSGYIANYLTAKETWQLMLPMAAVIQNDFKSWQQLEDEYLVGFQFWNRSYFAASELSYMHTVNRLLHDPQSPWVKLPWNTPLGVTSDIRSVDDALSHVAKNSFNSTTSAAEAEQ